MKISALVVTFNEGKHLEECLKQLKDCDQLIVIDLGSSDHSISIAKKYATQVIHHEWVPIVELVLPSIIDQIENDWIIHADPDEIYPKSLLQSINDTIENDQNYAAIYIPFQYYFLGKPIKRTVWGGTRYFRNKVFNKNRINFENKVHVSFMPKPQFNIGKIMSTGENEVAHYWVDSFQDLFEKHERYLKSEGKSRYDRGERYSFKFWIISTFKALYSGLIRKRGIIGTPTELFLSFYYPWYISQSILELKKFEKKVKNALDSEF